MSNIKIKNIYSKIKQLIYLIWFTFITWIAIYIYQMGVDTNTQGSSCDPYSWQKGHIYQWIWGDQPCIYTCEFLFGYIFYIQLYLMYDYIRRKIIGFNPGNNWRMMEVGIWFVFNWCYLLWLTATNYGNLDWIMTWTSFIGTLLFFVPIVILALITHYVSNKIILGLFGSILFMYFLLLVYLITTQ